VQVPYDEGVAIHIGPESCAVARESLGEALTGVARRPAIEPRKFPILGADTVHMVEGNILGRVSASAASLLAADAFAGELTRGSIETIPVTVETENTRSYREGVWLGDLDSNQD
jgi:hypothetical protein